ncbi:E3 SUMO-protein ligase ZBED1-like [Odontesthes bonariensis]|uniref:E3 SUMO-protein ligase ZBED1-like n=1 Tax=Odontesthes bonariensis TaxID=219752 RepID=UPI003F58AB20
MVQMFIDTGLSTRLCDNTSFKQFCRLLEHRFKTPGSARVTSLMGARMETATEKLKDIVREARRLTLCVDGWSKRGLTAAFLGVSACFYHPPTGKAQHTLLNLHRLDHPHTGEVIARCIDLTLERWDISDDKVLLVVTDNGSNIVKAIRLLRDRQEQVGADFQARPELMDTEADDTETESSDTEAEENGLELENFLENDEECNKFQRMPCLAHTLQLALKDAMKHPGVESTILKARLLVHAVRKSSVANEQMVRRCGKTLIRDCSTRWNSTLHMINRLLETKGELNQVLEDLNMDTLLTSDWAKLENLLKLFEPFAVHTDQLQNDSQSLSHVVPCLLNLEAHLLSTTVVLKPVAQLLLRSLRDRFAGILNPDCCSFDATAAGACLVDPSVSFVLHSPELKSLQTAAETFV